MADQSQKTEQPTPRKLHKSREDGNFPSARVFVSAVQFITFVALVHAWGPDWLMAARSGMALVLRKALDPRLRPQELTGLCFDVAKRELLPLVEMGGILMAVTIAIQLAVTQLGVSLKKLTPDGQRLSPLSHLRNLPKQNLPALMQALVMIPVFGTAVYYLVSDDFANYLSLPLKNISLSAAQMGTFIETLLWKASFLFLIFGAVDLIRQKRRHQNELKMSKQEIRDEMKEMEGSPVMKQRIRRIRRDLSRRRMMQAVATATAVVVNPTHYAVALKYDLKTPGAPRVVAKGKNYLALRIRQRAIENQVPLIENPPLAQGLYKSVEVGQEIPAQFYRAVAEVLAYIFKVMNGRRNA
jgi:flagellar biosynthetic protein FlhB